MDTANNTINRLMDLASDNPPWEQAVEQTVEDMGRAIKDHLLEEMQETFRQSEHHLYSVLKPELVKEIFAEVSGHLKQIAQEAANQLIKPVREQQEEMKKMLEALPSLIRMAVEGVNVTVQVPQPIEVVKDIEYDVMNRAVRVVAKNQFQTP